MHCHLQVALFILILTTSGATHLTVSLLLPTLPLLPPMSSLNFWAEGGGRGGRTQDGGMVGRVVN